MEQYIGIIFSIVILSFGCALGFSIVGLCYSYMKLKMTELEIWRAKK